MPRFSVSRWSLFRARFSVAATSESVVASLRFDSIYCNILFSIYRLNRKHSGLDPSNKYADSSINLRRILDIFPDYININLWKGSADRCFARGVYTVIRTKTTPPILRIEANRLLTSNLTL